MKIEHWTHENVLPDGICLSGGKVDPNPGIRLSQPISGGCGLEHCNCSAGHWLCINFGYNKKTKTVSGVTVYFDNHEEMIRSLNFNYS